MVLFITGMLLKVVPTFESEDEILSWTIHFLVHIAVLAFEWEDETKALEQLCPMVLVTIQSSWFFLLIIQMKASTVLLRKAILDNPVWSSLEVKGILVECVVPQKIHTHPMEGHRKFLGGGGSQKPKF